SWAGLPGYAGKPPPLPHIEHPARARRPGLPAGRTDGAACGATRATHRWLWGTTGRAYTGGPALRRSFEGAGELLCRARYAVGSTRGAPLGCPATTPVRALTATAPLRTSRALRKW